MYWKEQEVISPPPAGSGATLALIVAVVVPTLVGASVVTSGMTLGTNTSIVASVPSAT